MRLRDGLELWGRGMFLIMPRSELIFLCSLAYGLISMSRTFIFRLPTSKKYLPRWYLFKVSVDMFRCFYTLLTLLQIYLVPLTLLSPAKPPRWVAAVWATSTESIPLYRRTVWNLDWHRCCGCLSACLSYNTYTRHLPERYMEQGFAVNISDCGNDAVCYRHWQINFVIRYSNDAREHAVAHVLQDGRSRFRYAMESFEFLWPNCGPGVDSPSNRNEYQGYFLWDKGGRCVWLITLPPSCADVLEIWEPQPPGTLRASPGLYRNCSTFNHAVQIVGKLSHSNSRRLDKTSFSVFFDISG